jgi:hypothetical protein
MDGLRAAATATAAEEGGDVVVHLCLASAARAAGDSKTCALWQLPSPSLGRHAAIAHWRWMRRRVERGPRGRRRAEVGRRRRAEVGRRRRRPPVGEARSGGRGRAAAAQAAGRGGEVGWPG